MISIAEWRYHSKTLLQSKSESADIEINVILSYFLRKDLSWILAHADTLLSEDQQKDLDQGLLRLLNKEPLAYIIGQANFFGSAYIVNKDVLIPRPETEILVENALEWLGSHPGSKKIIDIGTGSGSIIISILQKYPKLRGVAVDISDKALRIADENKKKFSIKQLSFIQMNCMEGIHEKFDLIVANLPYIPEKIVPGLPVSMHEPKLALNGGADGLQIIKKTIQQIPTRIESPGLVLMEIQNDQAQTVAKFVNDVLPDGNVTVIKDYAGYDRIIRIEV